MSDADGFCVICKEIKDPLVTVTEREFKGLLKFSTEREDESVTKYLNGKLENNQITSVQIHEKCRKWCNNRKRMETNKNRLERKRATRRSSDEEFNWKENCCFCGNVCGKRKYRDSWHPATTMEVGKNIKKYCTDRLREDSGNEWAQAVLARVEGCIDLVAAEARYHSSCYLLFSSTASSSKAVNTSWLTEHNPFNGSELRSLSTGVCDNGSINCDDAEEIGEKLQKKIDNVSPDMAKIKRSEKVKNIESLYNTVKITDKQSITIKPTALFLRLSPLHREKVISRVFLSLSLLRFRCHCLKME